MNNLSLIVYECGWGEGGRRKPVLEILDHFMTFKEKEDVDHVFLEIDHTTLPCFMGI